MKYLLLVFPCLFFRAQVEMKLETKTESAKRDGHPQKA
ncbi:hypothetical protein Cylst_0325 [Cylindrospermum stagnale PCC 7417]|uniref:Uncharacterized protein n=1 Tax=Cylindrospermum stagnale PCC 7417 TaxID=56107 RepID=K9WT40_9NOST|nr:hypothetical protein Cylst_0325 [Cylindrospermum stagnale PCC 7417]